MLELAMRLGIDGLLSRRVDEPLEGLRIEHLLCDLGSMLDQPDLKAAVFRPPETGRGRVYLHLFDRRSECGCRSVGFAKISLDEPNNKCLDHEAAVLAELSRHRTAALHVPPLMAIT